MVLFLFKIKLNNHAIIIFWMILAFFKKFLMILIAGSQHCSISITTFYEIFDGKIV